MEIKEKACGCIIVENNKVLVIKQNNKVWGFPKGHVEENETEEQTAIREVKEETNIDVKVDTSKRYAMHYTTDTGNYKEVVFFRAKKIGGELKKQDCEIEEAKWVDINEAIKVISYNNTKRLYKKFLKDNNLA